MSSNLLFPFLSSFVFRIVLAFVGLLCSTEFCCFPLKNVEFLSDRQSLYNRVIINLLRLASRIAISLELEWCHSQGMAFLDLNTFAVQRGLSILDGHNSMASNTV